MSITLNDVVKLAKGAHALAELRSVVFDGKSAMTACEMNWVVGVPCLQSALTDPVVVPVDAIRAHLLKSRHLVVMPDHLTNGQGLVTPFNKPKKWDDQMVLSMLPPLPDGKAVAFDLELDALDRVLIATGEHDIRYYLSGVLFDLTDGVLAGTNGHQLHMYKNRVPKLFDRQIVEGEDQSKPVQMIVPRAPLDWIVHSQSQSATVTIWNPLCEKLREDRPALPEALVQTNDAFVWIRGPLEGKYPDWSRVIPVTFRRPVWMEIDPEQLSASVDKMGRVVRLAGKSKFEGVLVDFGTGEVRGKRDESGLPFGCKLHSDDAGIDLEKLRVDFWVGVKATYMQDLADCVTDKAQWRIAHECPSGSSLLVTEGDFSGIVMPMRIDGPEKQAPEPAPDAVEAPDAPETVETAQDAPEAQEDPETAPAEPCPAAVAALVAQLVGKAQETAKKAPKKTRKAAQVAEVTQAEPVAA